MKLHGNAALTLQQRTEVRRLHLNERVSIRDLAERFSVNPTTIQRWTRRQSPLDLSTAPHARPRAVITPQYRLAVVEYRRANAHHGPVRIAEELRRGGAMPDANRGTVLNILRQESLIGPRRSLRPKVPAWHIPVGRHRVQMDVQQLPVVAGGKGFEYKVSLIHLRTRLKYSEIHPPPCTSRLVAEVFERATRRLPPFSSCGLTTPSSSR